MELLPPLAWLFVAERLPFQVDGTNGTTPDTNGETNRHHVPRLRELDLR